MASGISIQPLLPVSGSEDGWIRKQYIKLRKNVDPSMGVGKPGAVGRPQARNRGGGGSRTKRVKVKTERTSEGEEEEEEGVEEVGKNEDAEVISLRSPGLRIIKTERVDEDGVVLLDDDELRLPPSDALFVVS